MDAVDILTILKTVDALTVVLSNNNVDTAQLALYITRARAEKRALSDVELQALAAASRSAIEEIPGTGV